MNESEKRLSAPEICSLITFYINEFEKLKKKQGTKMPRRALKWEPPQPGFYKINIDASYWVKTGAGGWGFVARDSTGDFLEGVVATWSMLQVQYRLKRLLL